MTNDSFIKIRNFDYLYYMVLFETLDIMNLHDTTMHGWPILLFSENRDEN